VGHRGFSGLDGNTHRHNRSVSAASVSGEPDREYYRGGVMTLVNGYRTFVAPLTGMGGGRLFIPGTCSSRRSKRCVPWRSSGRRGRGQRLKPELACRSNQQAKCDGSSRSPVRAPDARFSRSAVAPARDGDHRRPPICAEAPRRLERRKLLLRRHAFIRCAARKLSSKYGCGREAEAFEATCCER
jgi:hypothetical protein